MKWRKRRQPLRAISLNGIPIENPSLKGSVVNDTRHSTNERSLEITLILLLKSKHIFPRLSLNS